MAAGRYRRRCPRCGADRDHDRLPGGLIRCRRCGLERLGAQGTEWTEAEDALIRAAAAENQAGGLRTPEGRTHGGPKSRRPADAASYEQRLRRVAERVGRTYVAVNVRASRIEARSGGR